ncbi:hypothetical protein KSP40_PGU000475 [Platanthera guangdongensis]|uniref:Pyridoxamine 5'-phosphate oxidase N-terminal domain-containing protein n=1 Tax=Platanthera guangdongensis TaxID=2320717 RepID=A0ABR2MWY3_9ASPA
MEDLTNRMQNERSEVEPEAKRRWRWLPSAKSSAPTLPPLEQVRTVLDNNVRGALSTFSKEYEGYPSGSMVDFACDHDGSPILAVSSLAIHSKNLIANPKCSLLVAKDPEDRNDIVITLFGEVVPIDDLRLPEFDEDRRTEFDEDRRTEFDEDRRTEFDEDRRTEFDEDRRTEFDEDRRTEFDEDRRTFDEDSSSTRIVELSSTRIVELSSTRIVKLSSTIACELSSTIACVLSSTKIVELSSTILCDLSIPFFSECLRMAGRPSTRSTPLFEGESSGTQSGAVIESLRQSNDSLTTQMVEMQAQIQSLVAVVAGQTQGVQAPVGGVSCSSPSCSPETSSGGASRDDLYFSVSAT